MSYASSSLESLSQGYDVFISFRGEDTRTNFTSHLYDALTRNDIVTYKDDKTLEIGNSIAAELLEAIETSKFAVVVLSSSFATSKWCLDEIAKIVECRRRGKIIVIPVFYHVTPSDVRHQSNCFEQGFANHEEDPETAPKVKTWKAAFKEVAAIAGLHVTEQRSESEVVREIVSKILKDMPDTVANDLSNGLVGIESRVGEVIRILRMDSSEVLFIGICGMSGIGKTTLAEAVYKDIHSKFEKCSFIENIKDISKQNDSPGLCKLQQKLLDDILKEKSIRVQSVKHGQTLLGTKLRGLKVILVLDDVNHVDQLTYLAGGSDWFGPGTRIIVTTTNTDLLKLHTRSETYVCEGMKGDEALRLFCLSAFKQGHPRDGYEKLSDDMVMLAGGLPLALNVYGSHLCGKEEYYWKGMAKKFREYPEKEVLGRLEVVFARLDRDQRNTFIYIACFLKGRNIDLVKDILTNIGLYPECGIIDLRNKFLITINLEDNVWMHDLLQQMCWEILRKESDRYYGIHIAVRKCQDIVDALSCKPKITRMIEIINQEPDKIKVDDRFDDPTFFSKMRKLKFLRISNIHFHQGLTYLSNELRILEWYGCSLKFLPSMFEPTQIYELEMCSSQLKTLWKKDLNLPNLRSINLSFSKDLTKIPDLTSTLNLEKLNLEGCTNLTELHESVLLQKKLRYMNLKGCTSLQTLGRRTMEMEALEALLLSGCSNLEYIPEFGKNMKRLEHLYVDGTRIKKLPDNLGQMCHLRKLDASGTSVEELPSSIHHLKKLRLLRVNRCRLSFEGEGFPYANLGTMSSGLREVDLSYCNLSVVPDGIGLLCCLITLDLSGNEFVSLPASIGLLSKLRFLCLNNCKRLQSLPKLSLVDDDLDFGPRSRFRYYVSAKGIDACKFNATSNTTSLTVSCLDCPKLAENEHGSYLSEKLLNNYLQLRSNHWMTPEAVFEIVGAGRQIPPRFKLLTSDENLIVEGPWIGVAICAVIALDNAACVEAKYEITVHIHVDYKRWSVPIAVNFLEALLENQLVLYWTLADDFERTIDSTQKKCRFSFRVELGDGNLQLLKFGVLIIRDKDVHQLKRHDDSTSWIVKYLFHTTLVFPTDLQWYIHACEDDTDLPANHFNIHDLTSWMINFILDYREQQCYSLNGIHKILKCLFEINQQVLSECKEECIHTQLFSLVYEYYRISHGTSELCNDFVKKLKDISGSWLSVKLALEQIVARIRAGSYTRKEMLEQLNDLETANGVRISDNFAILFAYICKQTVDFSRHLNKQFKGMKKFKSPKIMAKASSIAILGILSFAAKIGGHNELVQEMKDITSYSMWLHYLNQSSRKRDELFIHDKQHMEASFECDLCISDFYSNAHLLQELKNKMARSNCLINEYEEEIVIVIDTLQKKINSFSLTIDDMGSIAYNYSLEIRKAGMILHQFVEDGNCLQVTKYGVCSIRGEDVHELKGDEDSLSEVVNVLCQATASLSGDLPWYVCACGADTGFHLCHSIVNDHNYSRRDSLDGIQKIFECLYAVLTKSSVASSLWRGDRYYFVVNALNFYTILTSLLKDVSDSWLRVKLALEEIMVKSGAEAYTCTCKEMVHQLIQFKGFRNFHARIGIEIDIFCEMATIDLRHSNDIFLLKESAVLIRGFLSAMAAYMGDSRLMEELKDLTSETMLLNLIQRISMKGGEWFDHSGRLMRRRYDAVEQIWHLHANVFLGNLRYKMNVYGCINQEIEDEVVILISKLQMMIDNFSETIQDMHQRACDMMMKDVITQRWKIFEQNWTQNVEKKMMILDVEDVNLVKALHHLKFSSYLKIAKFGRDLVEGSLGSCQALDLQSQALI